MSRYLLVSRSAEYETRLRRLFRSRLQSVPGEYLTFGADEVVERVQLAPAVALLGPLLGLEETKSLTEALTERHPGIGIVVVREQRADLEDWVEMVGMHAVLSPEATDAATEALLGRLDDWLVTAGRVEAPVLDAETRVEALEGDAAIALVDLSTDDVPEPEPEAGPVPSAEPTEPQWALPDVEGIRTEVITVAAPKGGQGKTTMAVNLAAGLAEVAPNSVVLIDADLQFGDIANSLNLTPRYSLGDLIEAADDEVVLKTRLLRHSDDFFVIPAPPSPEQADNLDAAGFGVLIDQLATMFRYVIIDTTPGLGEHALVALEHATDGVFVTTLAVPSLRALRKEFELLVALGLLPTNRHLVVNNVEKNTGLLVKDAEAILGTHVDIAVPRSPGVVLAANSGAPLIHHDLRDPAAKAVRMLVQRIEPTAHPTRRRIHGRGRRNEPQ